MFTTLNTCNQVAHWKKLLVEDIANDSVNLKRSANYKDFQQIIDSSIFCSFVMEKKSERLKAFSTAMNSRWDGKCTRLLNRTYYMKEYRSDSLKGQFFPNLATGLMLPSQAEACSKFGLDNFFISFEYNHQRSYINQIFNEVNRHWRQGQWVLLDGLHNVCKALTDGTQNDEPSCWQSVVYLQKEEEESLALPVKDYPPRPV